MKTILHRNLSDEMAQTVHSEARDQKRQIQIFQKIFSEIGKMGFWIRSNNFAILAFSLVLLFSSVSCLDEYFIDGNHSPVNENRYANNFSSVASSGEFIVNIFPGDEYSVQVTAESNLLAYIETDVVGHTLKISTRNIYNLHNHEPMMVNIVCPVLNGLRLSGSGVITTDYFVAGEFETIVSGSGKIIADVDADRIDGNISGSGDIILTGNAGETDFNISGSGEIDAYDLEQEFCKATVSGSGNMYVNVSKMLDVTISGSGKVFYINSPSVHTRISGSGRVVDRN